MSNQFDVNQLWQQVAILQFPQNFSPEQYQNADQFCKDFVTQNVHNLGSFFDMFLQNSGPKS